VRAPEINQKTTVAIDREAQIASLTPVCRSFVLAINLAAAEKQCVEEKVERNLSVGAARSIGR